MNLLIAEDDAECSAALAKIVQVKLGPMNVDLSINIVPTLREAKELAWDANATILDLSLRDAGPSEVIAAIPDFHSPIIVMTGDDDPAIHALCRMKGADYVFLKGDASVGICRAILHCFSKDVLAGVVSSQ